jgi:Cdc6-like AAA superfamily ATPase
MELNGSHAAQNTGPAKPGFEHLFDLIDETFLMHQAMREAIDAVESCIAMVDGRRIPPNVAILGESGVGKSTVIDEMERRYPPSETEEGTIRQVVRVEIEEVPGTRSLPAWTLRALGFPTPWKGSNGELTMSVHDLAKEVGVKVFVFDEVQHFVERDSDETLQKRANWFKRLTDETKASVVLVGLPHTVGLFHRDPQLKGRFRAPIVLPRFNWAIPASGKSSSVFWVGLTVRYVSTSISPLWSRRKCHGTATALVVV